jgi:hypothetical protein
MTGLFYALFGWFALTAIVGGAVLLACAPRLRRPRLDPAAQRGAAAGHAEDQAALDRTQRGAAAGHAEDQAALDRRQRGAAIGAIVGGAICILGGNVLAAALGIAAGVVALTSSPPGAPAPEASP